jgi:predicted acyl esterase
MTIVELNATSNAFLPGHRIRAAIMSCRFPSFCRNPNTGAPEGEDEDGVSQFQSSLPRSAAGDSTSS